MKVYCINLENRVDRWEKTLENFKDILPVERFLAVKHKEGWRGCILSHSKALEKIIYEVDSPLYCIIEDDCRLCIDKPILTSYLEKCIQFLKQNVLHWDIFYGGGIFIQPTRIVHKFDDCNFYIIECNWIVCTHFLIYGNNGARSAIDYPESECKYSIDNYLASRHKGKLWTTYPMLFDQYCSDTDIGNYNGYLSRIEEEFEKSKDILKKFVEENDKK
jgi:hypothetical protein